MTHALGDGAWVVVNGIQRWQSAGTSPRARAMYRELVAERYAEPVWWPEPEWLTDHELVCARRRRDALEDELLLRQQEAS